MLYKCSILLFSFIINDNTMLEGEYIFGGLRVRVLMYADDFVFILPAANRLPRMIANLELYCKFVIWGFTWIKLKKFGV